MKEATDLIRNITCSESRAHAYIIEGRPGKARERFVKTIAAGLLCRESGAGKAPCGHCDKCRMVEAGTEPDVVYMQMSGKLSYRTDDANAFKRRLSMRPYGRYLIGVINDAELLSETVQNKLLKTLEEPGDEVILLLAAAAPDELLNTVRSRCSIVREADYTGFAEEDENEGRPDLTEGAFMLLTQRNAFHEFREFIEKHIKTQNDALKLIALAEEKLEENMTAGRAVKLCADRLENAESAAADINMGMDRARVLKSLYLRWHDDRIYKA